MEKRIVPIVTQASQSHNNDVQKADLMRLPVPVTGQIRQVDGMLIDGRGRPLRDLRISVTDHCNFRCRYCMPREKFDEHHQFLTHTELLSFEEIYRLAHIFVSLGVRKLRLTGGEPLLRKHLPDLVASLKTLHTTDGKPVDVAITTNATLLTRLAQPLKDAGLDRITVSLDALDKSLFQSIVDVDVTPEDVLRGIDAARAAGLPVKVNTVVKRGMNEHQILPLAEHFRHSGVILRFIEYMDAGMANGWRMDEVVPSQEVVDRIHAVYPLEPIDANYVGETASRWRYLDGAGEIGLISSVTQAFCKDCSRARLSIVGSMVLCLFADRGYDLRTLLRGGATDEEIASAISRIWTGRQDHYSEIRLQQTEPRRGRIEMQYIGG